MSDYAKTKTRWEVNESGDLIHVGSGDPAWRTVTMDATEFPMSAAKAAELMNHAFKVGMIDPQTMLTRQLWAAWRDRAALSTTASTQPDRVNFDSPEGTGVGSWCAPGPVQTKSSNGCYGSKTGTRDIHFTKTKQKLASPSLAQKRLGGIATCFNMLRGLCDR